MVLPSSARGEESVAAGWTFLQGRAHLQREFFIDNLLVRIHFIIELILVDRPCAIKC